MAEVPFEPPAQKPGNNYEHITRPASPLIDKEAGDRYLYVVEAGQNIFRDSALTNNDRHITEHDLALIAAFHHAVAPSNPDASWRIVSQKDKSLEKGDIVDPSSYASWEVPGGPLEHINLASNAAAFMVRKLQTHIKPEHKISESWAKGVRRQIQTIEPLHTAAAAALHDEGREVTHLYYTNELIGKPLLQKMGIREDLLAVMPTEQVMLTPLTESMDATIQTLPAEAVIVRIADEFGKRAPGTNRLYQPADYDAWDRQTWANNYINRPFSGRPSDRWMREKMQLHVNNVPRYFQALDTWVQTVSTMTLHELTHTLNAEFASSLPALPQKNTS